MRNLRLFRVPRPSNRRHARARRGLRSADTHSLICRWELKFEPQFDSKVANPPQVIGRQHRTAMTDGRQPTARNRSVVAVFSDQTTQCRQARRQSLLQPVDVVSQVERSDMRFRLYPPIRANCSTHTADRVHDFATRNRHVCRRDTQQIRNFTNRHGSLGIQHQSRAAPSTSWISRIAASFHCHCTSCSVNVVSNISEERTSTI
jgi:hypothetical protein